MIGGNSSFGSGGWDQTVWDGMIPVDMSGHGVGESEFSVNDFRVRIPADAVDHPIWRIVDDPSAIARSWRGCRCSAARTGRPAQAGRHAARDLGSILESADVTRARQAGRPIPPSRPRPMRRAGEPADSAYSVIFSCQTFGRGRTFAMATDTTWAWGTEFEKSWGGGRQPLLPQVLAERHPLAHREQRRSQSAAAGRDRQGLLPPGRADRDQGPGLRREAGGDRRYRVVARLRRPTEGEAKPFDATATNLVPQLGEPAYRGKLRHPPASEILENPGSTVHQLLLDVAALDGDRVAAESSTLSRSSTIPSSSGTLVPTPPGSRGSPGPRPDA